MKTTITASAAAILFRQLGAAERQRLPLAEVLDILCQDQELFGQDQLAVQLLARLLREGQSLSAALAQLPELMPPATAELIQTAERQGKLAATLDEIADDYARQAQGRSALRAAIGWPIVLAIGIGLLVSLLMIFVIPTFKDLFQSFGADLPLLTLGLVWVSDAFANFWWLLLLAAILLFVAWRRDLLPLQALRKAEQLWLSIPFVRPYFVRRFATRMARWLRLCRDDQALLLASLRHVRGTERFDCFRACAAELEARLAEGQSLGAALAHNAPLPQRLALFVQLGEKLGDSAPALDQVIAMSERETADALSQFERGLTISSYLALGLLVGIIVIAIYLPIFKMGSVI